jgi:KDO2-lipid IV(A) lauroyltransferase
MGANLRSVLNSKYALALAIAVGQALPASAGRRLADVAARRIASRTGSEIVQAVRANQWVVTGETLSASQLDGAVLATFRHSAICLYNFYHNLGSKEALLDLVEISPEVESLILRSQQGEEAAVVVGVHMSNFDFIMRAVALRGLKMLAIAMPESEDTKGYDWQNKMRRRAGFEIMPASMATLRLASRRLQQGKSVITGLDRPLPESKYQPRFFGRPAALPVMHVHLALKTKTPVAVVAGIMGSDGIYRINVSDWIEMKSYADKRTAIVRNAESVAEVAAKFIRQAPHQWLMFYPVWPEAMAVMP